MSYYNKKFLTFVRRLVIARTIMDKYASNSYHTYLSNSWNPGWDLLDSFIREDNTNNAFFRSAWCSVITKPFLKRKMYLRWFHERNCFHYSLQHVQQFCRIWPAIAKGITVMVRCWYYLSNNASSAVLSHGTIYLLCSSNFLVCGWNPMMLPFKWNLFSGTFTWYHLFIMQF